MQYPNLIIPLLAISKAVSLWPFSGCLTITPIWQNIVFYPDQQQNSVGDPAKDIIYHSLVTYYLFLF